MGLSFYQADSKYCEFLRKYDARVPYVGEEKEKRPFIGILLEFGNIKYYAPLTSPKPKHITMKNQVDFLKIEGGKWGAINFNNMIPIHGNSLVKIKFAISANNSKDEADYKNLLSNQLSWCNSNREVLFTKAEKLYRLIVSAKGFSGLKERCCDFPLLEQKCIEYCKAHNFELPQSLPFPEVTAYSTATHTTEKESPYKLPEGRKR